MEGGEQQGAGGPLSCLSSPTLLGRWGPLLTPQGGCPGSSGPGRVQALPGPTWMNARLLVLVNVPTLPPMVMEGGGHVEGKIAL